jgi:transposase
MPKALYTDFVGIDVSKNKLDVYETKSKKFYCVSNDKEGIERLFAHIKPSACLMVLIDLTGGYEMLAVNLFVSKGFNVHRLQGRKFKDFRKSYGQNAKTDKIDAKMFTVYGAKMQETLRLHQLQDTTFQRLVNRRQDIISMLQQEVNRKEHCIDKLILKTLEASINCFKKQLEAIEQEIKDHIDKDEELKEKAKVIDSVKSVGEKTTLTLLALFPELGKINRRQAAALAGLAPYANDSGTNSNKRKTGIGRPPVKRALFMCVMSAIKHDLALKAFYNKLIKRGKLKMVAIVAVMRKLLIIINNRCKEFYFKRAISGINT